MKLHRYQVVGTGPFPLDMLRYDSCWPSRQVDVGLPLGRVGLGPHRVELVGIKPPTLGRWLSFGWRVDGRVTEIKP